MKKLNIEMGTLVILSGAPGSGKSLFTKQFPADMVVSTDALRGQLLGVRPARTESARLAGQQEYFSLADASVFGIVTTILANRLKQKLTTVLDSTALTDSVRQDYVELAQKYHVPVLVLIFKEELSVLIARNESRPFYVPIEVLTGMSQKLEHSSKFPFASVTGLTEVQLAPKVLEGDKWYVLGDVQGLLTQTKTLLTSLGFQVREDGLMVHPEGYRPVFLGDIIDRGQESIETLRFVRKMVEADLAKLILGNHELKLIRFHQSRMAGAPTEIMGEAPAETAVAFMSLPTAEQAALISFLEDSPTYLVAKSGAGDEAQFFALCHADQDWFDPMLTPSADLVYGVSKRKPYPADVIYDKSFCRTWRALTGDWPATGYILLRGHFQQDNGTQFNFSLEEKPDFGGSLVALDLQKFGIALSTKSFSSNRAAYESCVTRLKTGFDFDEHRKRFALKLALDSMTSSKKVASGKTVSKLASVTFEANTGLRLYSYADEVHFDNLWNEHAMLKKARGIVLDMAGNVVQHPFDKIFNYRENDTGLDISDTRLVTVVEKMNGFLGNVTYHPYQDRLLLTTTGAFDSPFTKLLADSIAPRTKGMLLQFFKNEDWRAFGLTTMPTLMFEVLHPSDPHIIPYAEADMGLWLIGARDRRPDAPLALESTLDEIAALFADRKLAGVYRAGWETNVPFGVVKARIAAQVESGGEGSMVRPLETDADAGTCLLKFKTPYYLVTKFLGRLSADKITLLYANPEVLKTRLDEEFYPIVDALAKTPKKTLVSMSQEDRVALVRSIIQSLRA